MFSSRQCQVRSRPRDWADLVSGMIGLIGPPAALVLVSAARVVAPTPGNPALPQPPLTIALEVREVAPEEPAEVLPEPVPEIVEDTPDEPVLETVVEEFSPPAPQEVPAAPQEEVVPLVEEVAQEGEDGREEAIRAEWLAELKRRIEQKKFYPGAARYAQETGMVLLAVEIRPDATVGGVEVVQNTGSPRLEAGALEIMRRVSAAPLSTNFLASGIRVRIPFAYRIP